MKTITHCHATSSFQTRKGFSLVEMMVVIVLIAIMSSMIIPQMSGNHKDSLLKTTARDIVQTLRVAHTQAVTQGKRHWFKINQGLGQFRVEALKKGANAQFILTPVDGVYGASGEIKKGVFVSIQNAKRASPEVNPTYEEAFIKNQQMGSQSGLESGICFHPDGTADRVIIILTDDDGFALNIEINHLTSRVSIKKGMPAI